MKILHVTAAYPPSTGGLERYVYELVNRQQVLGNDVHVITSNFPNNGHFESNIIRLPVLWRPAGAWGWIPICPTIFMSLKRFKPDITHVHYPPRFFPESTTIYRLLTKRKNPLILTCHLLHNESLVSLAKAIAYIHDRLVVRGVFRNADKIIALTENYKTLINRVFKINPERIAVIPSAIDDNVFNPQKYRPEHARKKFGICEENVILFLGRLLAIKGVDYLIKAFRIVLDNLPNVSIVIVGDGPFKSQLQSLSQKLKMSSHIKFMGQLPHEDVPEVLSLAKVLVLPSLSEGCPLVLLEAMSMEKPVVATHVGGIPDFVVNGETGILVKERNVPQLANAILSILSDKKLALYMGQHGKKIVQESYTWSIVTQKIMRVYKEVLAA